MCECECAAGVPGLTRVLGTLGVLLGAGNVQRVGLPHVETWEHSTAEMTVDEFNSQFLILICILEIAMQIPIWKAMEEAGAGICRAPLRQGRVLCAGKDLPQCPCADFTPNTNPAEPQGSLGTCLLNARG